VPERGVRFVEFRYCDVPDFNEPDTVTFMPETWRTRLARWGFNWFPAYRATGARVTFIADDWMEVRIHLPLNWRTRNYVGTIFGGSMYGAIDPVYMLMLIKVLGREYVVWDKAATIRFRRPGREALYATFRIGDEEVSQIRAAVAALGKVERELAVDLVNRDGVVHASFQKVLSIRAAGLVSGSLKSDDTPRGCCQVR
jgi:acyl-coenzyme A thioesterase PaaI-like protein